ncbi:MAG: NAD-dependent epimerase/dehydratase family protein [Acidimicrobiia bacterium]|nr:NAD-dependent epimerase/dehydratase family protein [Acidimicrobiia bacterium]
MTTLVTGASGFIGSHLVSSLAARGEEVRVLARPSSDLGSLAGLGVAVVRGDLSDPKSLREAAADVRVIYHCAALASDWGPWADFVRANVGGVASLLDAAVAAGTVERFVHVSTTDVYGYPRRVPEESGPRRDVGLAYNRSKILGELLVEECHRRTGLPTTIVRPVTVFGERSQPFAVEIGRLLLAGQMPLIGGGTVRAGLIYVADLVDAMITAAIAPQAVGQAYNLRDPEDMTWRQFIVGYADGLGISRRLRTVPEPLAVAGAHIMERTYRAMGRKERPLLTHLAVKVMTRDQGYPISRAQRDLGFAPRVGLEGGQQRTIEWLLSPEGQAAIAAEDPPGG